MRALIVAGILGTALPAFAVEEAAPGMEEETKEAVAQTPEAAGAEGTPTVQGEVVEAAPAVEPEPSLAPLSPEAVARGTFTTAVDQREPVDSITSLASNEGRAYYFTELIGIGGREVTHRWKYKGEIVAEVPIAVGGPRWRAYSSKTLNAGQLGEWTVTVVDETGAVLRTDLLVYEEAAPEPEPEVAAPTEAPDAGSVPEETPASAAPVQP